MGKFMIFLIVMLFFSNLQAAFVADEYVVQLKPQAIERSQNSRYYVVKKEKNTDETSFLKNLNRNPAIQKIERNIIFKVSQAPNDQLFTKMWALENTGQKDQNMQSGIAGIDIRAKAAWKITQGSRDVRVAVVDTGINLQHPDLQSNIFTNLAEINGLTGVDDDQNGYIDDVQGWNFIANNNSPLDDMGHGTHVAGIIGASGNNGIGITGVNWQVSLIPIKSMNQNGSGTLSQAIESIRYAMKMNAHIINASWGSTERSEILESLLKEVADQGILFVASAGNNHLDSDARPVYPASYNNPYVLPVAAIDSKGNLASFSNWGWKTIPVAAPGVSILSTKANSYATNSGTSMASPHVAGIAALLQSQNLQMSALDIKEQIIRTSVPLVSLKNKIRAGLVNAERALLNEVSEQNANDAFFWPKKLGQTIATPHPYLASSIYQYEIEVPEARRIALYFQKFKTEKNIDILRVFNREGKLLGELSGSMDATWSVPFESNYLKLEFKSNSMRQSYGFDLTELAFE